ncbi:MAG: response regulator [Desulfobacteraceae bacterium]|jgi:putative two-component system response regulator
MKNGHAIADILVVDDDPAVQRMMRRILGRPGYHMLMANGGQDAFDKIADHLPDLIMLDLSMPMLDGFEVVTHLKSSPLTRDIPVILMTGLDSSQNHVRALDVGANDFLSKTAEPEEILARVRSHLKVKQLNDQLSDYQTSL